MSLEKEIEKAFKLAAKKVLVSTIYEGIVTSVDRDKRTCEVDRNDLPNLQEVRLNAILEPGANVVTIFPTVGSKVLCAIIENDPTDAVVIATTEVEEFLYKTGSSEISVKADGIVIQREGTLKQVLDKIIDEMAAILVQTPSGISDYPVNKQKIKDIKDDIANIFRA